ncbi:MAG: hypothetical protein IJL26_04980 [Clostridia bacterium]|nr:hypothetical protein [Clostridia bacterium]
MKKSLTVFLIVLLAAALIVGAAAVVPALAKKKTGNVKRETLDRVDFTLENVNQTFSYAEGGQYIAELVFTAKKTEADFYAVINDISVAGAGVEKTEVSCAADSAAQIPAIGAVLPAENGEPLLLKWTVRVYFSAENAGDIPLALTVDFTSGVKKEAADRRFWTAELMFSVEE